MTDTDTTPPAPPESLKRQRIKKAAADAGTSSSERQKLKVNLALQGGGAHGAFTWGVLDRLLEDPDIEIDGISGTSAGAMNAAVLATGYENGGAEGARAKLTEFWSKVSEYSKTSPLQPTPWDRWTGNWNLDNTPAFFAMDLMSRLMSPYQMNPSNFHPLREVLNEVLDLDFLHHCRRVKLFISATNVRTGKIRVFKTEEITVDALLASACLPTLFQAIEVDGEAYWDGGFMGNPALYPLFYHCQAQDVIIIQINPLYREKLPTSAREILDRVNEISFNSSLMREMRAIDFVTKLIDAGKLDAEEYKRIRVHMIEAESEMRHLGFSSKLMADWGFLTYLRDLGRKTAATWLENHKAKVGVESSIELDGKFL